MKDRNGHVFADLVAIQVQHVELWLLKLQPALIEEVDSYLQATNLPAADETQKHRVFRGQDLVQIIMEWPNLSAAYPKLDTAKAEDLV